jgi:putative salt-induced outer membrane protein
MLTNRMSRVLRVLIASVALPTMAMAQEKPKPKPLEFSAAAGFAQTSGNADALTTNFGNKLKYTVSGWVLNQDLSFFYGEANDKVNANFWNGGVRAERSLTPRVGLFVMTRFDRNVLQGIASRFEEGFGLDAKLIVAPRDRLSLQVGGSAFQVNLTPGSTTRVAGNFPAARVGLDYKHNFSELAFFQQTAEYLPNLRTSEAYLVNTESALVAPLSKALGLKFGYVVRYNAAPPVRNGAVLKKTDTFFTSGLTFSY